jgi:DUF971 family protein
MTIDAPEVIRAHRDRGLFELKWPGTPAVHARFFDIRCGCTCAVCVDEFTGEPLLDPAKVPREIAPLGLDLVGQYAIRIRWSDGHDTGLYTWARLHQLSGTPTDI